MTTIHPTAVIGQGAEIGDGAEIGPYCVIGSHVRIGAGTVLKSHVVLDGWTTLGSKCTVFPFASIGGQTQDLKFKGGKAFVEIGDGTTLREYVTVNAGTNEGEVTKVGSRCLIMAYAHVAHACNVGDEVIMVNGATLAGEVTVEGKAIVGGLSAVHQFTRIGRLCIIGGLTRVTQDCPPYMMVVGNPAEVHGPNTVGLQRHNVHARAQRLLKDAYRILYRENLSTRQALDRIRKDLEQCLELEYLVTFIEKSERGIVK